MSFHVVHTQRHVVHSVDGKRMLPLHCIFMSLALAILSQASPSLKPKRNMTHREGSKKALRIFVLADTHNRLPESVKEIAKNADEIWHLGDVCAEAILDELRAVGPCVTQVRGNCDSNFEWPQVVDLVRGGLRFRLQHVPPDQPPENADVLLHGHTHVPRNEKRGNVLFLNPGCVTRPNRGSPPSVARLEIANGKINWKIIPLR